MRDPFGKKPKAEPVNRMYFVAVTPPEGPAWWGVRSGSSEDGIRQEVADRTGLTRQAISGRVSVTLLRPPAGKEYREREFTITRKPKEEFLRDLLGSAL